MDMLWVAGRAHITPRASCSIHPLRNGRFPGEMQGPRAKDSPPIHLVTVQT
jgi:hypothetical protein